MFVSVTACKTIYTNVSSIQAFQESFLTQKGTAAKILIFKINFKF